MLNYFMPKKNLLFLKQTLVISVKVWGSVYTHTPTCTGAHTHRHRATLTHSCVYISTPPPGLMEEEWVRVAASQTGGPGLGMEMSLHYTFFPPFLNVSLCARIIFAK